MTVHLNEYGHIVSFTVLVPRYTAEVEAFLLFLSRSLEVCQWNHACGLILFVFINSVVTSSTHLWKRVISETRRGVHHRAWSAGLRFIFRRSFFAFRANIFLPCSRPVYARVSRARSAVLQAIYSLPGCTTMSPNPKYFRHIIVREFISIKVPLSKPLGSDLKIFWKGLLRK